MATARVLEQASLNSSRLQSCLVIVGLVGWYTEVSVTDEELGRGHNIADSRHG